MSEATYIKWFSMQVLDDCRRHLAKSQAENMELRTALEREKDRADTNESRVRDLQQIVQQARSDNDELEEELDHTLSILDRSKPGIDALKQQNAKLHGKASVVLNENSTLKRVCFKAPSGAGIARW